MEHNFVTYFGFACLSALISSFFTMPMDTVKTRLNTQCDIKLSSEIRKLIEQKVETKVGTMSSLKREKFYAKIQDLSCECTTDRGCIKYTGPKSTAKIIYYTEGFSGFYKGFVPRATLQSLSTAVAWSTYEFMKGLMRKDNSHAK